MPGSLSSILPDFGSIVGSASQILISGTWLLKGAKGVMSLLITCRLPCEHVDCNAADLLQMWAVSCSHARYMPDHDVLKRMHQEVIAGSEYQSLLRF